MPAFIVCFRMDLLRSTKRRRHSFATLIIWAGLVGAAGVALAQGGPAARPPGEAASSAPSAAQPTPAEAPVNPLPPSSPPTASAPSAAQPATAEAPVNPPPPPGMQAATAPTAWPPQAVAVLAGTAAVLAFGAVCLLLQFLLLRGRADPEHVLRNMTVTLVVTLGTCTITLGYNQNTIAPIIGLFGTIIGFLLGQKTAEMRASPPGGADASGPGSGSAAPDPGAAAPAALAPADRAPAASPAPAGTAAAARAQPFGARMP